MKMFKLAKILFFITLGVIIGTALPQREKYKTYIYVDMEKIVKEVAGNLKDKSDDEIAKEILEKKQKFEQALKAYEKKYKALILSSPKPLRGATDKTDYFIQLLR